MLVGQKSIKEGQQVRQNNGIIFRGRWNNCCQKIWFKSDWCTNKKLRKILAKICFWIKTTGNWRFPGLPNLAFYCDQIPSCSNPVNPNYHLLSSNYHNYVLFLSNC